MKKLLLYLLPPVLLFTACTGPAAPKSTYVSEPSSPEDTLPVRPEDDLVEPEEDPALPGVYLPEEDLSPEEVVEAYLTQQYLAYTTMTHIDLSALHVMEGMYNRYMITWMEALQQRRRLLWEHGIAYVEAQACPWELTFLEEEDLLDERIGYWRENTMVTGEELMLHFTVTGAPGQVYPPLFAMNAQHTMRLRKVDGEWRIVWHYFPGVTRKVWGSDRFVFDDDDMLQLLADEFRQVDPPEDGDIPSGALPWDGERAAAYGLRFTETPNPEFYHIGDWMGNCANFTSQCIWYGFGDGETLSPEGQPRMTGDWFAGEGGGSPAWENVNRFRSYILAPGGLYGVEVEGISQARAGDIIQIRNPGVERGGEEDFTHTYIVLDADTLLLGQNSPGHLTYYSDVVGMDTRIVRPVYLAAA